MTVAMFDYVLRCKSYHIIDLHWLGFCEEIEELEDMFINGEYTPFSDTPLSEPPVSKKHPLVDATNEGNKAKKRKVQAT